jgi:hypothetical protein
MRRRIVKAMLALSQTAWTASLLCQIPLGGITCFLCCHTLCHLPSQHMQRISASSGAQSCKHMEFYAQYLGRDGMLLFANLPTGPCLPSNRFSRERLVPHVFRQLFDISIAYETDPNEKNFKAIHNHVQNMSGRFPPHIANPPLYFGTNLRFCRHFRTNIPTLEEILPSMHVTQRNFPQ